MEEDHVYRIIPLDVSISTGSPNRRFGFELTLINQWVRVRSRVGDGWGGSGVGCRRGRTETRAKNQGRSPQSETLESQDVGPRQERVSSFKSESKGNPGSRSIPVEQVLRSSSPFLLPLGTRKETPAVRWFLLSWTPTSP